MSPTSRRLATYIEAHGFRSQLWKRYVSPEEVLRDCMKDGYCPISEMIREEHILDAFPAAPFDLYLWIVYHRERLRWRRATRRSHPQAAKDDILKNVPADAAELDSPTIGEDGLHRLAPLPYRPYNLLCRVGAASLIKPAT